MKKFLMLLYLLCWVSEATPAPLQSQFGTPGGTIDTDANLGGELTPYGNSRLSTQVLCASGSITDTSITLTTPSGFDATGGTAMICNNTGNCNNFTYTGISGSIMGGIANISNGQLLPCTGNYLVPGSRVYSNTTATNLAGRLNVLQDAIQNTQRVVGSGVVPASNYASLFAAVAAIGSVTPTTLVISSTLPYGATVTVPPNITMFFRDQGKIDCSSASGAVTIQGDIQAPNRRIFINCPTGSITISNNHQLAGAYPQWWGAVGDGATDDIAQLQASVTSMLGGGVLYLDSNFAISTPLLISNGTQLTLQGLPGGKITQLSVNTYGIQIKNGSNHITLKDFIVSGPHTAGNAPSNRDGVLIGDELGNDGATTKSYITVQNLTINGFTHSGIGVIALNTGGTPSFSRFIQLINNHIFNCQNGIFAYKGVQHLTIAQNFIENVWYDGIAIDTRSSTDPDVSIEMDDVNIIGNTIVAPGIDGQAVGILLKGKIYGANIVGNILNSVGLNQNIAFQASYGLFTEADAGNALGKDHTITGNTINGVFSLSGPPIGMSINDHTNISITGNTLSDIAGLGINTNQVTGVTISGNSFLRVGGASVPVIYLDRQGSGATTNASVTGNSITKDTAGTTLGIYVDHVVGVQVVGNFADPTITTPVFFTSNVTNYQSIGNTTDPMSMLVTSPMLSIGATNNNQNAQIQFLVNGVSKGRFLYAGTNPPGSRYVGILVDNGADDYRLYTQNLAMAPTERLRVTNNADVADVDWSNVNLSIAGSTTAPTARLQVDGGIKLLTNTLKPTCDVTQRGLTWFAQDLVGGADTYEVCSKDGAGVYAWRSLI